MIYNIYFKTSLGPGPIQLFGLSEEKLANFVDIYNKGAQLFFWRGDTYRFSNITSIKVFDSSGVNSTGREEEVISAWEKHFGKGMIRIWQSSEGIARLGKDVTNDFIKGEYGNSKEPAKELKAEAKQVYVDESRIEELSKIASSTFDLTKLIRLCIELNSSYYQKNFYAVGSLVRAIIDHVPPIFGFSTFSEVANNYSAAGKTKSFKDSMDHLDKSMRKITDSFLHSHITKSQTLPNDTQVDCKRDLDHLLEEVVRLSK